MQPTSPSLEARTLLNRRRHLTENERSEKSRWLDYWDLIKPEISFLVTISAVAGFVLGSPDSVEPWLLAWTILGIAVTAAGSGALNHVLEHRPDSLMRRTAGRPIPSGRVPARLVVILGVALVVVGLGVLLLRVNGLTAGLGAVTVATYLFVYTPLKRKSKFNTLVGCIPGALPALGGWTAATAEIGLGGVTLFLILFIWQMPHFLSLAWMYRKDYARADFAMLPVVEPSGRSTARQILLFTAALLVASAGPFAAHLVGMPYLAGALVLGLVFLWPAIRFKRTLSNRSARAVLLASILYIPALVVIILVDRFI